MVALCSSSMEMQCSIHRAKLSWNVIDKRSTALIIQKKYKKINTCTNGGENSFTTLKLQVKMSIFSYYIIIEKLLVFKKAQLA